MTLDQNENRKMTIVGNSETLSATPEGQARGRDMKVSLMLLVLLIAITLQIPISGKIPAASANRQSFFAQAVNLIVNMALSIGASSLPLSSRPENHRNGSSQ